MFANPREARVEESKALANERNARAEANKAKADIAREKARALKLKNDREELELEKERQALANNSTPYDSTHDRIIQGSKFQYAPFEDYKEKITYAESRTDYDTNVEVVKKITYAESRTDYDTNVTWTSSDCMDIICAPTLEMITRANTGLILAPMPESEKEAIKE